MLKEEETCVKQSIQNHMLLSNAQRKAHVDLNAPCIPVVNKLNTSVRKAGEYSLPAHARNIVKETLTEYHNLEPFKARAEKVHVHACHMCKNYSTAPNGFVCKNPLHLYFGTVSENTMDKPPEVRKRVSSNAGKKGGAAGAKAVLANGNHMNKQKRTCVICGYEGNPGAIAQWHNENCKYNPLSARFKKNK